MSLRFYVYVQRLLGTLGTEQDRKGSTEGVDEF